MRRAIATILFGSLFAGLGGGTAFSAPNGAERPWRASGTGIGVFTDDGFVIDGTSINTYLGKATFHAESTSDGGLISTVTAANGDELIIVASPAGQFSFAGGTGRFEDASGTLTNTSVDEFLPGGVFTVEFSQEGTITL